MQVKALPKEAGRFLSLGRAAFLRRGVAGGKGKRKTSPAKSRGGQVDFALKKRPDA